MFTQNNKQKAAHNGTQKHRQVPLFRKQEKETKDGKTLRKEAEESHIGVQRHLSHEQRKVAVRHDLCHTGVDQTLQI